MTNAQVKTVTKFAFAAVSSNKLGTLYFLDEKPADVFITSDQKMDTSITEFGNRAKLYMFRSSEDLLKVCNYHDWVQLSERKRVKGKDVTFEDAVKSFEKHAKTKEEREALSATQEERLYEQYMSDVYPSFD